MDKVKFNPFSEILEEDFNRQAKYVNDGVSLFISDFLTGDKSVTLGLNVKAQAVADMTVYVTPGRLYQVGKQGQLAANSNPPLVITAAHPNYDRIDRICARYAEMDDEPETRNVMVDTFSRQVMQKTVMTRIASTVEFMVVNGTAAPTPVAPTVPDGWVSLAKIDVSHGSTSIMQTAISDERPTVSAYLKHMHTGGGDGARIQYKDINGAPDLTEHNTSETAHEDIRTAITEATKKAGLPVGFEYTIPYTELQSGQLALLGGKYLKSTYADLWTWVQTHPSMIVTEEQWQTLKTASGGRAVPYYSNVDEQYFRVPLVTTWVRGASSLDEVGAVLEAGLPNITGEITNNAFNSNGNANGCFSYVKNNTYSNTGNVLPSGNVTLDASKSSSIYGKSTTVQPQSICRLWVVQAFGTNSNTGNMDVAQVAQGVTDLTGRVSTLEADSDFTIIYPNGGTKETPATVSVNSRYICDNPFPGYEVYCVVEVQYSNQWGDPNIGAGSGVRASQLSDSSIVVQTGISNMISISSTIGNPFNNTSVITTPLPCRVKVWKVGKIS